ncbi:hypothetical protein ACQJBY_024309 [Aegilops geniculata]
MMVKSIYEEALMDACKQIERQIETKTEASLKEGLGQQPKTDHMEKTKAETKDCLNSVPHIGIDIEDRGSNPGSNINEEGRDQFVEDTDLEERGHDVEITGTEASEGLLYEEVATLLFLFFSSVGVPFFCSSSSNKFTHLFTFYIFCAAGPNYYNKSHH